MKADKLRDIWLWRVKRRVHLLERFAERMRGVSWSPSLMRVLLEELHTEDVVTDLVGDVAALPLSRYPEVVAVAVAYRHSWKPDDFESIVRRLRLKR
jgi:hypothetical protein